MTDTYDLLSDALARTRDLTLKLNRLDPLPVESWPIISLYANWLSTRVMALVAQSEIERGS